MRLYIGEIRGSPTYLFFLSSHVLCIVFAVRNLKKCQKQSSSLVCLGSKRDAANKTLQYDTCSNVDVLTKLW